MNKGYIEFYGDVIQTLTAYIKTNGGWKDQAEACKAKLQTAHHSRQYEKDNLQDLRKDTKDFCQTLTTTFASISTRVFGTWVTHGSKLKQELELIITKMDEALKPSHRKNPVIKATKTDPKELDCLTKRINEVKIIDPGTMHNVGEISEIKKLSPKEQKQFEELEEMLDNLQNSKPKAEIYSKQRIFQVGAESNNPENATVQSIPKMDNVAAFIPSEPSSTEEGHYYNKAENQAKYEELEQKLHQRKNKSRKHKP